MAGTRSPMLSRFRQWLTRSVLPASADADLVERFTLHGDEGAFTALVERHGPMVLGVAQRVVGDSHVAEDVLQATFVMLARRAGALRGPAALPAWLHTTAYRLAVSALRSRKRRQEVETHVQHPACASPLDELSSRELLAILDEELQRLPETLRLPLILCTLEGRSQEEVAAQLGCTPASVRGRLERGRQRLRDRLARRGLMFAVGAGVPLLLGSPTLAGTLRSATLQGTLHAKTLSPAVAALVNGAQASFLAAHWKLLAGLVTLALAGVSGYLSLPGAPNLERPATLPVAEVKEQPAPPRGGPVEEPLPNGAIARLGSSKLRIGDAALALTADETRIVTVTAEGVVRTFDAKTGQLLQRRQLTDRSDVHPVNNVNVMISTDGKIAAFDDRTGLRQDFWGTTGRRVSVWNVDSGKLIFHRQLTDEGGGVPFALSPDGKQLALIESMDGRGLLSLYDVAAGRNKELGAVEFGGYSLKFSANGKRLFLHEINRDGGAFTCYDVANQQRLWRMALSVTVPNLKSLRHIALSNLSVSTKPS